MYFHYVAITSPTRPFIWTNLNSLYPRTQEYFMPCLSEISLVVLEKILKSCQNIFTVLLLFPFRVRTRPFIWQKLDSQYPKMPRAKFGWNWPGGSEEEVFNVLSLCRYYEKLIDGHFDRQTYREIDNKLQVFRKSKWGFSSGEQIHVKYDKRLPFYLDHFITRHQNPKYYPIINH